VSGNVEGFRVAENLGGEEVAQRIQEIAGEWGFEYNDELGLQLNLGLLSYKVPRPISEADSERYRDVIGLMGRMAMLRYLDVVSDLEDKTVLAVGIALRGAVAEVNEENLDFLKGALQARGLGHLKVVPFAQGIKRDPQGNPLSYFTYYPEEMLSATPRPY